jgi:proline dehydrogenase
MKINKPMSQEKLLDFSNTQIAFSGKTDKDLKQTAWLFRMMNKQWLVNMMSPLGLFAVKYSLPFSNSIIKKTIFKQFCGGTTLLNSQDAIDHLNKMKVLTVLDYGAESKTTEDELNHSMNETIKAVEFAASNAGVPVVSTKVTALSPNEILEKWQTKEGLNAEEEMTFNHVLERVDQICSKAHELGAAVFVDAEETWMQDTIDHIVDLMMEKYNQEKIVVYNTFQMYRKDRLAFLKASHEKAQEKGYILGAKIVRGAYMEKERRVAKEKGYPSPIQDTKSDSDKDFNAAIRYCVENYETIASCNASHNVKSNLLQAELIAEKGIVKNHQHLNFCQLYGMSDYITFNLANAGYNVAKYVVYGEVKEVVPYLIRRAQENTSVTGEMSRELNLISKELKRRGL